MAGAERPVIRPGFALILPIRGHQYVLRPADQKTADKITLFQEVNDNVETAHSLLTQRGLFLVAERQQVMRDIIADTDSAIERVVKLLNPARVDQVTEDNAKNPFVVEIEEAKAAATFGRLQIASNRLGTVLHDLLNIEPPTPLNPVDTRVNTGVKVPPSNFEAARVLESPLKRTQLPEQSVEPRNEMLVQQLGNPTQLMPRGRVDIETQAIPDQSQQEGLVKSLGSDQDLKSFLTLSRSRRINRSIDQSTVSSVSGPDAGELDNNDSRAAVNYRAQSASDSSNPSIKGGRDTRLNGNSINLPEVVTGPRLITIHELDGVSTASVTESRQIVKADDDHSVQYDRAEDARVPVSQPTVNQSLVNVQTTTQTTVSTEPEQGSREKTYADLRKRRWEARQEPKSDANVAATPSGDSPESVRESRSSQPHEEGNMPAIQDSRSPIQTDFNPAESYNRQRPIDEDRNTTPATTRGPRIKLVSRLGPPRPAENPSAADGHASGSEASPVILTATRVQIFPQSQSPESISRTQMHSPPLHLDATTTRRDVQTEFNVGRVPTLLRVGERRGETVPIVKNRVALPYPVSEAGSDLDEDSGARKTTKRQRPISTFERSTTAPALPYHARNASTPLNALASIGETPSRPFDRSSPAFPSSQQLFSDVGLDRGRLDEQRVPRSQSDNAIKEPTLVRAPTIPRKPLPYSNDISTEPIRSISPAKAIDREQIPIETTPRATPINLPQKDSEDNVDKPSRASEFTVSRPAITPIDTIEYTDYFPQSGGNTSPIDHRPWAKSDPDGELKTSTAGTEPIVTTSPETQSEFKNSYAPNPDFYRSSFYPPSPIGSGKPQPDEKLETIATSKDQSLDEVVSRATPERTKGSKISSAKKSFVMDFEESLAIIDRPRPARPARSVAVENEVETQDKTTSLSRSESVQTPPVTPKMPGLWPEDVSQTNKVPLAGLTGSKQLPNPLAMHPVNTTPKIENARSSQAPSLPKVENEDVIADKPHESGSQEQESFSGPIQTSVQAVTQPMSSEDDRLNVSRHTSRSYVISEPVLQSDNIRNLANSRRASVQGSVGSASHRQNSVQVPNPQPGVLDQVIGEPQFLRGQPQPISQAPNQIPDEPPVFQAQNAIHQNLVSQPSQTDPFGERRKLRGRELFKEYVFSSAEQQPSLIQPQDDRPPPLGYFPGPGVYHLQQSPQQSPPISPPQGWQQQPPPNMHYFQMQQQQQQPAFGMQPSRQYMQPNPMHFPAPIHQQSFPPQYIPQNQHNAQMGQHFQFQPAPAPLPPGFPNDQRMYQQPYYQELTTKPLPLPPFGGNEYSAQQISPIQSPKETPQQLGFSSQRPPPRQPSPSMRPRPMSYASSNSQHGDQYPDVAAPSYQSSTGYRPVSVIQQPVVLNEPVRLSSLTEGVAYAPAPSVTSSNEFAMGRSTTVPNMTGLSSSGEQLKNRRSTWLQHQASKMGR